MSPRVKPCASCGHPKSRHRTHECRHTWQTKGQTFAGIAVITKWCTCTGYRPQSPPGRTPDVTDETDHLAAADVRKGAQP